MAQPGRDLGVDIGLSGLTKWIRYPRVGDEAAGLDVVRSCADQFGGAFARPLLVDSLRLLDSPLSERTITAVWLAATFRDFDLERLGVDGREWLRGIVGICSDRIRRDDPSFTPTAAGPVADRAMTEAVLTEIRSVAESLEEACAHHSYNAVADVVPALEQVVTEADPDLGYRLLLRVMKAYFIPISEARYERYLALGEEFGLGEDVVDDGDFNIWPDLD
ncbi:hypothetical protein ACIRG4_32475 [Streptomyces sp. NPDC102395]|uniref:hypothetical protein n=1 Tax=Streptomyces sp. NPDC102395 TaxID=3366168 RepID=UPI0038207258